MTTENLEGLLEGYYLGCGALPPQDLRTRDEPEIETKNQSEAPHTLRSEALPLLPPTRVRNPIVRRRGYFRHSE